ncbi:hypothetical protein QR680_015177 [Steinernema hermaphroditum]|uniref:Cullin family profile domain-containing protein n=1 Tax=Steinernema hermaphroditum TaxID=289476 RepID=A0AA39IDQ1_9BILA|nr:hypothetical protein QR680_015177 [Steinernema hermaphroditum]
MSPGVTNYIVGLTDIMTCVMFLLLQIFIIYLIIGHPHFKGIYYKIFLNLAVLECLQLVINGISGTMIIMDDLLYPALHYFLGAALQATWVCCTQLVFLLTFNRLEASFLPLNPIALTDPGRCYMIYKIIMSLVWVEFIGITTVFTVGPIMYTWEPMLEFDFDHYHWRIHPAQRGGLLSQIAFILESTSLLLALFCIIVTYVIIFRKKLELAKLPSKRQDLSALLAKHIRHLYQTFSLFLYVGILIAFFYNGKYLVTLPRIACILVNFLYIVNGGLNSILLVLTNGVIRRLLSRFFCFFRKNHVPRPKNSPKTQFYVRQAAGAGNMESLRHQNDLNHDKALEFAAGDCCTRSVARRKASQPIAVAPIAPPVFDNLLAFSPNPRSSHPTSLSRLSSNIYIASSCPSYHPDSQLAANFRNHLEAIGEDSDNNCFVYKTFMKAHSCYDITPHHAKLLTVDTRMPVTWSFVIDNLQRSAVLWDSRIESFVGMLTITDFIRVYLQEYKKDLSGERLKALTEQPIDCWLKLLDETERPQELLTAYSADCLYTAVESLCSNEIHRLPIIDDGEIVFLLTRKNVLKFLNAYIKELPCPEFMSMTPQKLGIGSWNDIWTLPEYTPLVEVLRMLMDQSLSAVPITYDDGSIKTFSRADMIAVLAVSDFSVDLSMPISEALDLCEKSHDHLFVFGTNESLKEVVETIAEHDVQCVYITDEHNDIIAAISLSDILKKIVLAPDSPSPSRSCVLIIRIFRHLTFPPRRRGKRHRLREIILNSPSFVSAMSWSQFTFEAAWEKLGGGLRKIFSHEKMTVGEYMTLYQGIYAFCSAKKLQEDVEDENAFIGGGASNVVYEATEHFLRQHIEKELQAVFDEADDEAKLKIYATLWDKFHFSAKVLHGLYRYINRHWVQRLMEDRLDKGKVFEIYTLCMITWKSILFEDGRLDTSLAAFRLMNRERDGENGVNVALIQELVESYIVLGIEYRDFADGLYPLADALRKPKERSHLPRSQRLLLQTYEKYFETPMLADTLAYYKNESAELSSEVDIYGYMERVEERLKEEDNRSKRYLCDTLTNLRLRKTVENAFIGERLDLFQSELLNLLKAEKITDLNLMYRVASRVQKVVNQLKKDFRDYVTEKGREAIANIPNAARNDPKTYVATVLQIHNKYKEMVRIAFEDNNGFSLHFDESCMMFVNQNAITQASKGPLNKSAELLAKFVDMAMRKGGGIDDIDEAVNKAITVFMYIEDKDTFQKYYNRLLSKRLIMELSVNDDYEKAMIARLKNACGHEYVHKSMKMFSDIEVSKTMTKDFHGEQGKELQIEANFQILSSGSWSLTPLKSIEIPPVIQNAVNTFNSYYSQLHQGRKLTYLYGNSRGELSAHLTKKKFTLVATTSQMALLLKYNDSDSFTSDRLRNELQLEENLFNTTVTSLVNADILKADENKTVFTLNEKFSPKRIKTDLIRLQNQVAAKIEGRARNDEQNMEKTVESDRQLLIQAAIVRIMKMRRRIKHCALIAETVDQVNNRFHPTIPMIKKCIDLLIEKDYLKRSPDDRDAYDYVT